MAETLIQWTDRVWNFLRGCTIISPGCKFCYAMKLAHRFNFPGGSYEGLTELGPSGPRWTGKIRIVEEKIAEPLHVRKPQRWFVNSMSDLFHEDVPFEVLDKAFAVMALCPDQTFQVLTKRPERMREYFTDLGFRQELIGIEAERISGTDRFISGTDETTGSGDDIFPRWTLPFRNVWLGVSVENQDALKRIDILKDTPAAVSFVSFEPLLEDLGAVILDRIHWAIIGGESGPKARPLNLEWIRSLLRQCRASQVTAFTLRMTARGNGNDLVWSLHKRMSKRTETLRSKTSAVVSLS